MQLQHEWRIQESHNSRKEKHQSWRCQQFVCVLALNFSSSLLTVKYLQAYWVKDDQVNGEKMEFWKVE